MQHILFFFFVFFFFWGGGGPKIPHRSLVLKTSIIQKYLHFFYYRNLPLQYFLHFTLGSITQKLKIPFPLRSNSCWEALHLRTTFVVQSSCNAIFTFQVCSIPLTEIFFGLGGGEQNPPQFLGT